MSDRRDKAVGLAVAIGAIGFSLFTGAYTAVIARALGLAAYPTFFGWYMLQSCLVLIFPWRRFPWLLIRFDRAVRALTERISKGRWKNIGETHGPFWLIVAIATLIGPVAAAIAVPVLRINESRAWRYLFYANLIATVVVMSFYLGVFAAIAAWWQAMFN